MKYSKNPTKKPVTILSVTVGLLYLYVSVLILKVLDLQKKFYGPGKSSFLRRRHFDVTNDKSLNGRKIKGAHMIILRGLPGNFPCPGGPPTLGTQGMGHHAPALCIGKS